MKECYSVLGGKGVNISTTLDDSPGNKKKYYETTLCFEAASDLRIGALSEILLQRVERFIEGEK
jgi:hypothetical protein